MTAIPLCLPDSITPEQFLSEYWQKKPLLIRQGLPQLVGLFEPEDMLGLALDEDASARLLSKATNKQDTQPQWQLKKSPLTEADFAQLPEQWTVLIQNLEQWSPEIGQLWQAFAFVPQWQRDDIMVSYAPKGGSVGQHYDDYDVFLAQGFGTRRWQLGTYCNEQTRFVTGEPIRLLDEMGEIVFDEVLTAGDVLYVPPRLSHFGVAQDDCLTFSFGCRRPNLMQIIDSLADVATHDQALFVPMQLPQVGQASGELLAESIEAIKAQLLQLLTSQRGTKLLRQAICEVVGKRQYDALIPEELPDLSTLMQALSEGAALAADPSHRLLYVQTEDGIALYANGQQLDTLNKNATSVLMRLANGESLYAQDVADVDPIELSEWVENGWLLLTVSD